MFDISWLQIYWSTTSLEIGNNVAVSVSHFGFYSLNACRIVYVLDEQGPARRFGFAYGTLEDHSESGEERFTIERNEQGEVWYDILAFSRPHKLFAKVGYPLARFLQRKFAHDSKMAMFRAINPS